MRARIRPQASTKWWILLAVVAATAITWWESGQPRPRPRPAPAPLPDYIELTADDIFGPDAGAPDAGALDPGDPDAR